MRLTSSETLKALIDQREFSYERLARYSGCSKSFISHLVKGRKNTCTPELAERMSEALQVPRPLLFVEGQSAASGSNDRTQRKVA